jgi:hypothetical protein
VFKASFKDRKIIKCLKCGESFHSLGKWNKVCRFCKRKPGFGWDTGGYKSSNGRK